MCAIFRGTCFGFILLLLGLGADAPATAPALKEALTIDLGRGVTIEFVLIHPGSFMMGSEKGDIDEKPVHKVTLTKPFYLGKFEVTQEQWQAVMGENPAEFKGPKNPVENVSWEDCQEFLLKLAEKIPGRTFKLPTEAQWAYACRAGSVTDYAFGDQATALGEYAWYSANSASTTHPVGQKRPNAWDLYDMHGNVCEWCADWYGSYSYAPGEATDSIGTSSRQQQAHPGAPPAEATDPTGAPKGDARVLRGESWVSNADTLRSDYRVGNSPAYRNSHIGLRVVCLPPGVSD